MKANHRKTEIPGAEPNESNPAPVSATNSEMKKMTDRDFDSFANTSAGRCAATLLRTHAIKPSQIYAMVHAEVTQSIPYLAEGRPHTTELLCDPAVWSKWFTAERRVAGMCLAYMVRRGLVKLCLHITRSGKGSKRYFKRNQAMTMCTVNRAERLDAAQLSGRP